VVPTGPAPASPEISAKPDTAASPAGASAPAPAPAPEGAYQRRVADSPYQRVGVVAGGDFGLRACVTDSCRARTDSDFANQDVIRPGASLRASVTYRFIPYLSAGAELEFALHGLKYRVEETDRAFLFTTDLVAILYGHPLAFSRWDPFVGFGIGYEEDVVRKDLTVYDANGTTFDAEVYDRTRRGVFRFALGLDVFVTERLTVGPRFNIDRQFSGKKCTETTWDEENCYSIAGTRDDDPPPIPSQRDPIQASLGRMFFAFGAAVRFHIGR
jgi:hypothetical protein